nr:TetR/AcrR family transcriptional regulator [Streptomyces muensis]
MLAVGTLYRHFPTKTDLVASAVAASIERVADEAEAAGRRLDDGANALEELSAYLARVVDACAANQAVKAAAQTLGADGVRSGALDRADVALARLIEAGQADGDIHPDVTVADLHLLCGSIPTGGSMADRARWHTPVMAGPTTRARPASA